MSKQEKYYKLKALSLHMKGRVLRKEENKAYKASQLGGQDHATRLEQLGWIEEVKASKGDEKEQQEGDTSSEGEGPTKKEIIKALEDAEVEHDPKAKKSELLELYQELP